MEPGEPYWMHHPMYGQLADTYCIDCIKVLWNRGFHALQAGIRALAGDDPPKRGRR